MDISFTYDSKKKESKMAIENIKKIVLHINSSMMGFAKGDKPGLALLDTRFQDIAWTHGLLLMSKTHYI